VVKTRFLWKLYAGYSLLVLLAVVTVGVLVGRRITTDTLREVERSLLVQAHLLQNIAASALAGYGDTDLQAEVRELGDRIDSRLTVIRADGIVLADSEEEPSSMDNHGSRPEVVAARMDGVGVSTRFSRTVAANLMYVALPVTRGDEVLGYVRASLPLTIIRTSLNGLRGAVALGAIVAAAIALLFGFFVARRVTAPLTSMTDAAESIAAGDYGRRVGTKSGDEIGQLANSFNRMASELEKRVQTITEDRAKLLTVLGGMVEGVVAVDGDQKVVHLNAAAGRILGVASAESIGNPIWEVTRVRKVGEALEQTLKDAREVSSELRLIGEPRDKIVDLHAAPLQSGQGGLVGAVLVLHEVTELRRLETVRQDFVANVSHELKTPITAIRGLIDTVVEDQNMPIETRTRFLGKVQEQSRRLSLLVTDLLTLARLESADGMLESETLDLRDSVSRSISNLISAADDRGIELLTDVPEAAVRVVGDYQALELVVNNLLDNALKYTPQGGKVWVRVDTDGKSAILEVVDTGIGIAREHHERIFERFYRVDKARSREVGGTGLGLSIVKHICKLLGGSVSIASDIGVGSTFRVRLPLSTPAL
jgi:two-component system phosphate regulon sensor histidine kinase PhoR